MKVRAAVLWAPEQPLEVTEVDLEDPKSGEVLIRVCATSICHTDILTALGKDSEGVYPVILGHEGAGVVERVGEGVQELRPGDVVVPLYQAECRDCEFCKAQGQKRTNLCGKIRQYTGKGVMALDQRTRFSKDGKPIHHFMGCSTFTEFTVIPEIALAKISPDIAEGVGMPGLALLGCGVTTGFAATINAGKVQKGDNVLVTGLGCVGLAAVLGARAAGAARIIGVDINENHLQLAKEMGLTDFILSPADKDPVELLPKIIEMTDGGVDFSFDCTGVTKVMRLALEACHKGWGQSVIIGVAPTDAEIATKPFQLVTGRVWKGTAFGGVKGRSELESYAKRVISGDIPVHKFITHSYKGLDGLVKAFEATMNHETIRATVDLA